MIDDKFDALMSELKREESLKSDALVRASGEFQMNVNAMATQLKTLDGSNEKALRAFSDGFKKEAGSVFETIKNENDLIDSSEAKVQALVKEVADKSTVS